MRAVSGSLRPCDQYQSTHRNVRGRYFNIVRRKYLRTKMARGTSLPPLTHCYGSLNFGYGRTWMKRNDRIWSRLATKGRPYPNAVVKDVETCMRSMTLFRVGDKPCAGLCKNAAGLGPAKHCSLVGLIPNGRPSTNDQAVYLKPTKHPRSLSLPVSVLRTTTNLFKLANDDSSTSPRTHHRACAQTPPWNSTMTLAGSDCAQRLSRHLPVQSRKSANPVWESRPRWHRKIFTIAGV